MATIRQKRHIKIMGKNGSKKADMIAAGYARTTARSQPKTVIQAKGWLKLLEKYLPDDKLLEKHNEALDANKVISAKIVEKEAGEQTNDFIEVPDHQVRLKAVELGYKVKGNLKEKIDTTVTGKVVIEVIDFSGEHERCKDQNPA